MTGIRALACVVVAFAAISSTGCASSNEESTEGSEGAMTFGSRFRSSLEPGIYDDGESSVRIFAELTAQEVEVSLSAGGLVGAGEIDISDGVASTVLSGSKRFLRFTQVNANELRVEGGDEPVTLKRREKNSWKGSFLPKQTDNARITIHTNDDDSLVFSLQVGTRSAAMAVADVDYDGYRATIDGCSFRIIRKDTELTLGSMRGPCEFLPRDAFDLVL